MPEGRGRRAGILWRYLPPISNLRHRVSGSEAISNSDQERWDARWATAKEAHVREPHSLLVRFVSPARLAGWRALDVACGVGQNAIWLAQHGFTVDAVDISPVAIERGRIAAAQAGVSVGFVQADLDMWMPTANTFDLVIGFRFLNRRLWPRLQAALRPGGWLLYQTFNLCKRAPDSDFPRRYLLDIGELPRTFAGWKIIEAGDDGGPSRDQSWIVCRKPDL
jgi:tellurite methyltransferase